MKKENKLIKFLTYNPKFGKKEWILYFFAIIIGWAIGRNLTENRYLGGGLVSVVMVVLLYIYIHHTELKNNKERQQYFLLVSASISLIIIQISKGYIFTSQLTYLSTKFPLAQIVGGYLELVLIIILSILIIVYKNRKIAIIILVIASLEFLLTMFNTGDEPLSVTFYLNSSQLLGTIVILLSLNKLSKYKK